ncbi:helix-turn-helix domain-containing protein [Listeria booriae]|uniref:Uncharacterized protein n=1 Tax=Listeria booriae TaxID=1552123 RepID=A0A7X0ZXV6_9LIST|nr:helix-turn-helix domain-containing protein [Listeria booriae]MBC1920283.1 hypothetical protein [Listeria booriae]MBC2164689.1 hypothetical protein [Listeria booriae]MBC2312511.1 hypothetical protein [Listeria booriae]MCD2208557.1 hypothetical protein [Listeria booriae]MDT0112488.1 helix-turn-helix domain-containing protein [Listeria booriae]
MKKERLYRLNDPDLMTSSEASERWGLAQSYVRQMFIKYPDKFKPGTYRKFGKVFIITKEGMEHLTGKKELKDRENGGI